MKTKTAPLNCFQWYTPPDGKGQIKTFNWKDNPALLDPAETAPTRQLANQNTFICIRPKSVKIYIYSVFFCLQNNLITGDYVTNLLLCLL